MNLYQVSPARRFAVWALEIVLIIGSAYVGWLIWSLMTWKKGQTPAQNLLRIVSINTATESPAERPRMFIRYVLIFTTYWFGYFAISNISHAINSNGILLGLGVVSLLIFHLWDISGILRRPDGMRIADLVTGIAVVELETRAQ